MRMILFSIGVGIHIFSLASLKLNKTILYTLHAPIVILSHSLHVFNLTGVSDDQVIVIYG